MTALVNILSQTDCFQIYGKDIPNGMLCAGVPEDYLFDVCPGDTGGPLICNNTLTAVTSARVGCGKNRTPSLYTDVWHAMHWIRKNHSADVKPIFLTLIFCYFFTALFLSLI